ncbi:condensation domain-containing protein [Niveibacterium umoris]|uniref:Phthiocerol/phthiodiolone dimycocerosyl transferase n=1 Tax=Niveibacterium umoris TaxID=1193620 RepID=A0A840BSK5_9RHOO|nr:hypothetical protein [Niveibacterium umoris]MBB4013806.1 NRPS condensation-like uncharacterized protein [Niveibacterium umoris]
MVERPLDYVETFFYLLDKLSGANFVVFAERNAPLDVARLPAALTALQAAEPLLQVAIHRSESGLHFAPAPGRAIAMRSVETDAAGWQAHVEATLAEAFADGEAPLLRCLHLAISDSARSVLALVFHHSIADGRSGAALLCRLLSLIAQPERPPAAPPQPPMHALFPPAFRWDEQEARAEAVMDALTDDINRHGAPARLRWLDSAAAKRDPRFIRIVLDAATTQRLLAQARAHHTTVHGALCAAQLIAHSRRLATDTPPTLFLSCPADMRPHLAPAPADLPAALYVTLVTACHVVAPQAAFWPLAEGVARQIHDKLKRGDGHLFFYLYGLDDAACDADAQRRFNKLLMNTPQGSMISNLGRIDTVAADPAVASISFALCPMPYQSVFSAVSTYAGRLTINMGYDAAKLAPDEARGLAASIEAQLIEAAASDGATVDDAQAAE